MVALAFLVVLPAEEPKSAAPVPFDVRAEPADARADDALLLNHVLPHKLYNRLGIVLCG